MIRADTAAVVALARTQLGYAENPPHSNRTKYGAWFGWNGVAWCAIFVSWVFAQAGHPLPAMQTSKGFASVAIGRSWAIRNRCWRARSSGYRPKPGDIVVYSVGGRRPDHTGIHVRMDGSRYVAVEGNTNGSGSRTGGSVLERARSAPQILGWIEVTPVTAPVPPTAPVPVPVPDLEDDHMTKLIRCDDKTHPHFGMVFAVHGLQRMPVSQQDHARYVFLAGGQAELDGPTWDWFMRNTIDVSPWPNVAWNTAVIAGKLA